MIKEAIGKVIKNQSLTMNEMAKTFGDIMDGKTTPSQVGAFVSALRMKGETVDEITGAAKALQERVPKIHPSNHLLNIGRDDINVEGETILETSDIGKSGTNTFNISTATMFVVAGGGIKVARHGNRFSSMYFGAADVLDHLGINLDISHSDVERCLAEVGIGFLFTPLFHGAMKHITLLREEMGIRTIFNLIGPIINPASASTHVLGVYESSLTEKMVKVLKNLGAKSAFVVCGEETFDEISICGATKISRLNEGKIESYYVKPEEFGLKRAGREEIRGGSSQKNAEIIQKILEGENGPKRDVVVLNSAAAFVAAGIDKKMEDGIKRASGVIDSGKAKAKLETLIDFTNECSPFVRK